MVPGARPPYWSDDSTFVCASTASVSMGGSWPIGICCDAEGGAPSAARFGSDEHAAAARMEKRTQPETAV
ncbi:MAG: hypothetical protein DMG01_29005 [Acidobacteria bacterium]|nr:MAG: hypothetical protein DMG01_29005 [Acidobacteriota bacterium]